MGSISFHGIQFVSTNHFRSDLAHPAGWAIVPIVGLTLIGLGVIYFTAFFAGTQVQITGSVGHATGSRCAYGQTDYNSLQ